MHQGDFHSLDHVDKIFSKLTPEQIGRIKALGNMHDVQIGEVLVKQGGSAVPFFVVVSGEIEIVWSSDGVEMLIIVHGPGQFMRS